MYFIIYNILRLLNTYDFILYFVKVTSTKCLNSVQGDECIV